MSHTTAPPDPRDLCGRPGPHGPHFWTGHGPGRPEYHGKTFRCPGKGAKR